ncbi:hypothetical protein [Sphingomonas sp. PAMC 26605]|uniref:hypothetical protein n=1 Tax=Sphingomonas sp. PAMC 26605 TaxID=1112214 RepID=UPI0004950C03|nr:hypothetical protein [Sphingomonas sp. PAMC 26605]
MPFARFERDGVDYGDQVADLCRDLFALGVAGGEAIGKAADPRSVRFGDMRMQRDHLLCASLLELALRVVAFSRLCRQGLANICEIRRARRDRPDKSLDRRFGGLQAAR